MGKIKVQPQKVQNVFCTTPSCKELLIKLYPWARFAQPNVKILCGKCINRKIDPPVVAG